MKFKAKLGRQFRITSQFGSEKFHPGLRIHLSGEELYFSNLPQMDHNGVLLSSVKALANVFLEFKDGAKVRFSYYPVTLKAGSVVLEYRDLSAQRELSAA